MPKIYKSSFSQIKDASISSLMIAPLIYSVLIPFVLLDIWLWFYQIICFKVYKIERVDRSKYLVFDRGRLNYLNTIEKFNCNYCTYGNGLIAYAREIACRTEQYFCPIKHRNNHFLGQHHRYKDFVDFGNASEYRKKIRGIRKSLEVKQDDVI